jgi:hypothetical protein
LGFLINWVPQFPINWKPNYLKTLLKSHRTELEFVWFRACTLPQYREFSSRSSASQKRALDELPWPPTPSTSPLKIHIVDQTYVRLLFDVIRQKGKQKLQNYSTRRTEKLAQVWVIMKITLIGLFVNIAWKKDN